MMLSDNLACLFEYLCYSHFQTHTYRLDKNHH